MYKYVCHNKKETMKTKTKWWLFGGLATVMSIALIVAVALTFLIGLGAAILCSGPSPSRVTELFYVAANHARYEEAASYFCDEARRSMAQEPKVIKVLCLLVTRNGSLTKIDITSQKITGNKAVVKYILYYGSQQLSGNFILIREKDGWRITK